MAEEAVRAASLRRDAIRRIVQGAQTLLQLNEAPAGREPGFDGAEYERSTSGFPRGRTAILALLGELGMEMEQRQIFKTLEARGWIDSSLKDPFTNLRVTLRRMWKAGELEKPRDGVYRLPLKYEPPDFGPDAMGDA